MGGHGGQLFLTQIAWPPSVYGTAGHMVPLAAAIAWPVAVTVAVRIGTPTAQRFTSFLVPHNSI